MHQALYQPRIAQPIQAGPGWPLSRRRPRHGGCQVLRKDGTPTAAAHCRYCALGRWKGPSRAQCNAWGRGWVGNHAQTW